MASILVQRELVNIMLDYNADIYTSNRNGHADYDYVLKIKDIDWFYASECQKLSEDLIRNLLIKLNGKQ